MKRREKELKKLLTASERETLEDSRRLANAHEVEQARITTIMGKRAELMTADDQEVLRRACLAALSE